MKNDDMTEFARLLTTVSALYKEHMYELTMDIYWQTLMGFELIAIKQAFYAHLTNTDTGQFMAFSVLRHIEYQVKLTQKISLEVMLDELMHVQASFIAIASQINCTACQENFLRMRQKYIKLFNCKGIITPRSSCNLTNNVVTKIGDPLSAVNKTLIYYQKVRKSGQKSTWS